MKIFKIFSKKKDAAAQTDAPIGPKKPSPAIKRKNKGTLTAIGALLLASAAIRAATGAGEAFANEPAPNAAPEPEQHQAQADHAAPAAEGGQPMMADSDILPLIQALNARETRIKKRESDLEVRMQALSLAEQEIDRKLEALEQAEANLKATLAIAQTAAEDDLSRLTNVYANMKPKQAAALFEEMDPEFSAGFLGRMKPDAAAAIMAGLTPQAAYLISVVLAGRNANVPKE
ncbi:MotE family protein [Tropicibacter naphthalenivorans]|uniref:Magnesium transporter MgtE intracellular domain-containing protein n=1 Tax=Tropicibacter naphthalenivorans TaxID=441103 RepID=A0A0P1GCD6_9RHOB|nr:hypothetical protein [Tropicibacter naphthalenivorans]CUH79128.1 hypothetical protein TRN7648_02349 [Tropicibacter naphthalenivorans]SMD03359.1 Flagellar motility protein MotE, a chaperone for MotC folding [Tropicibacter naphthalenivorans]